MKNLNVAVIGSGYWGKNLVRNFDKLGALKLICDKNGDTLSKFKEQYSNVDTCFALNDVLGREDIDGIIIATPAETHYSLASEALLANKHVYVEKPLVLNEKEGEELISIAKKKNLVLMVGHLLQYHPVFVRLKELVSNGELGKINYIYSHRLNLGKIRLKIRRDWQLNYLFVYLPLIHLQKQHSQHKVHLRRRIFFFQNQMKRSQRYFWIHM